MRLIFNGVKHSSTYFLTVKAAMCIMYTGICVGFTTDKATGIILKNKNRSSEPFSGSLQLAHVPPEADHLSPQHQQPAVLAAEVAVKRLGGEKNHSHQFLRFKTSSCFVLVFFRAPPSLSVPSPLPLSSSPTPSAPAPPSPWSSRS